VLKARVLTALGLLPLALLILFVLPETAFALCVAGIVMMGAWEWVRLSGLVSRHVRWPLLVGFAALLGLAYELPMQFVPTVLGVGCLFWALAAFLVMMYPRSRERVGGRRMKLIFGLLVLIPAYVALLYLRRHDAHVLLIALLVAIIWAADVGAYFVGRRFGTSKLAPEVSPGKSWAGLIGGVCVALVIGLTAAFIGEPSDSLFSVTAWGWLIVIVAVTVLFSVLGDLFESLMKREHGVKDSSSLLPGHGGVMDRIDSLTAATPVFALMIYLTNWPLA